MKGAFAWSVRRELWEHRSVFIAPSVVAALVLAAALIGSHNFRARLATIAQLDPLHQQMAVTMPFVMAAAMVLLVSWVVGGFYSFDSLNTERRDRSILFWKSMPVSDAQTVLSKAFVPMVVQPLVGFLVALATQAILLVVMAVVLGVVGVPLAPLWEKLHIVVTVVAIFYAIVVNALWYAPLYAFFMLLSAWVRRPFLWLAIGLIGVAILEQLAFRTSYTSAFVRYRVAGAMNEAFVPTGENEVITSLSQLDPARFLSSPGLWLGLLFAAAFLYAAIHIRRSREPF